MMDWQTLHSWIWATFYVFLLTTIGIAVWNVRQKRIVRLSIATIILTITIPITGVINSIGRQTGMNELEHLILELQKGAIWSVFLIIGLLFLLGYWCMFLVKIRTKISY